MQVTNMKRLALIICLALVVFSGCTNWERKYENLNVAYKNLEGRLEYEKAQKGQLSEQISQGQQTIAELQRKIADQSLSPAMATGFGEGYDVVFDPTAGTIKVTLPNAILFKPGKASLRKSTSTELDHIRSVLEQKYSNKQIDVVGHTDSDPIKKSKWKDNWELSSQRALSVVRYLVKQGIAENQIRAVGSGAARPIESNVTTSGKAKNRRVVIVVRMR